MKNFLISLSVIAVLISAFYFFFNKNSKPVVGLDSGGSDEFARNKMTVYESQLSDFLSELKRDNPDLEDWSCAVSRLGRDSRYTEKYEKLLDNRHDTYKMIFGKKRMMPYRYYIWEKFYDDPVIDVDIESHKDPWKDRAFNYLCRIDPAWVVKYAHVMDCDEFPGNCIKDDSLVPSVPEYLSKLNIVSETQEKWRRFTSVWRILRRTYTKITAEIYIRAIDKSLNEIHYDLHGKDLLDVGTGCGAYLPFLRDRIGQDAVLAAADIDSCIIDASVFLNKDFNVKTYVSKEKYILSPEDSYDVITMFKVALGPGTGAIYESHTVPWLRSVHKALRQDGLLIIYDDEQNIKDSIEKYVSPIGFEKIYFQDKPEDIYHGSYIYIFKVKK